MVYEPLEEAMAKKRSSEVKQKPDAGSASSSALPRSVIWHEPDETEFRHRVEQKAYELFQRRGSEPGHDVEDWLEAERLVRIEVRGEIQHVSAPFKG